MNPFSFFDWLMSRNQNQSTMPMGGDPNYQPQMWSSGSPAGDDGGIMGGGDSLAKNTGWSKDEISGGMMAAKGLGAAINAATGYDGKPIQAPRLDDNSGAIRQQAGQMWQQVMQKKPRGLI